MAESKIKPTNSKLSVDVLDLKGKVIKAIDLPKELFGEKMNEDLLTQALRVYLANQRRGTVKTKSRGEVSLTTAKWYRQKGTGRARHGAKSAPIFVGGGVAFGPKPRDYSLSMPKKMKRKAFSIALSAKLEDGAVKVIEGLEKITPKTKEMITVLNSLSLNDKKRKILLVLPEAVTKTENVYKAARNIDGVEVRAASQINTYEVVNSKNILFMDKAIETMTKHYLNQK